MNITTNELMKENFRIEKISMGAEVRTDIDYDTIHGFNHLEDIEYGDYLTDPSTREIDDSNATIKYSLYKDDMLCAEMELVDIEDIVRFLKDFFQKQTILENTK